jgi:hypothetical protein
LYTFWFREERGAGQFFAEFFKRAFGDRLWVRAVAGRYVRANVGDDAFRFKHARFAFDFDVIDGEV